LEATRELFVGLGYEALTVRKVAARVGISHGAIYLYFRDKEDLLTQVSEDQFARLLNVLRRLPRTRKPADRLGDALRELGAFGVANPHEFHLMMGTHAAIVERRARTDWGPMAEQLNNFMTDLVAEAAALPKSERGNAAQLAAILTASVSGAVTFAHGHGLSAGDAANLVQRQANLLICGLTQIRLVER
jgi:AcrR family transcriptional regulator